MNKIEISELDARVLIGAAASVLTGLVGDDAFELMEGRLAYEQHCAVIAQTALTIDRACSALFDAATSGGE